MLSNFALFSQTFQSLFGGEQIEQSGVNMEIAEQQVEFIVDKSDPDRPRKYIKTDWLGKGGFATCYRVVEVSKEKKQYACKIIDKKDFAATDPRDKQHADNRKLKLQREVKIQKLLEHEHLVKLVHHFEDIDNIYLILDLCPH